jgi:hypothetical protein
MADQFTVTRTATFNAAPEVLHAAVNDFHRWQEWSPWEELDPNQSRTYSGPDSGVGAHYAWSGNKKVGQGSMEIIESEAPSSVVVDLSFIKPFKSRNETRFTISPEGSGSTVVWSMTGPVTFMTRVMGVFKSMDAMIGPDFEKGLRRLKGVVDAT